MILFNTISKTRRIIVRHKYKDDLCYTVPNKLIHKKETIEIQGPLYLRFCTYKFRQTFGGKKWICTEYDLCYRHYSPSKE